MDYEFTMADIHDYYERQNAAEKRAQEIERTRKDNELIGQAIRRLVSDETYHCWAMTEWPNQSTTLMIDERWDITLEEKSAIIRMSSGRDSGWGGVFK